MSWVTPRSGGSLNKMFGSHSDFCVGLEEWAEGEFGNAVVKGSEKSECQDRVHLCPDLKEKSRNTRNSLEQRFGELPKRTSLFAVFDGHAGADCSHFLAQNVVFMFWKAVGVVLERNQTKNFKMFLEQAMTETCLQLDQAFLTNWNKHGRRDGSTGNICVVWGNLVACANVGDCRAIVCVDGKGQMLCEDHKPSNPHEKARIEKAGSSIYEDRRSGEMRIKAGNIAVSRAFGNKSVKHDFGKVLIATPDVRIFEITPETEFLVMASDGVWCRLESEEAVQLVRKELAKNGGDCHEASKALIIEAKQRKSNDDVSVIVATLKA